MAKLNEKQTLLTIAGVTVLLCAGAGGGVWWAQDLVAEEHLQIEAKEAKIASARAKIAKIPAIEDDVIILRESVAHHVKILPSEADLTKFTRDAQVFAVMSGIGLDRFEPVRGSSKGGAFQRVSYQLFFDASLWQFLKLVNFFENYERFVNVQSFALTAGGEQKPGDDVVHKIRLTVETYMYGSERSTEGVKIANYEGKKAKLKSEIKTKLLAPLAFDDPHQFTGREGRRDIFVDPRQPQGEGDQDGRTTPEQQKQIIETYALVIGELGGMWEASESTEHTMFERIELKRKVREKLAGIRKDLDQVNESKQIRNPSLNTRWYKDVLQPYKELTAKINQEGGVSKQFLSKEEFETVIDKMKKALTEGELETALGQHGSVQEKISVPQDHPLYAHRIKIEGLALRAQVALEFARLQIVVTGVLVNTGGKSGVILNGEVYEEGEWVSDQLFVRAVRNEEVEFVYKGFTLVKTF